MPGVHNLYEADKTRTRRWWYMQKEHMITNTKVQIVKTWNNDRGVQYAEVEDEMGRLYDVCSMDLSMEPM